MWVNPVQGSSCKKADCWVSFLTTGRPYLTTQSVKVLTSWEWDATTLDLLTEDSLQLSTNIRYQVALYRSTLLVVCILRWHMCCLWVCVQPHCTQKCVCECVWMSAVNCPVKQNCSRPLAVPGNHFQMVLIAGYYPTHCGRSDCRKLENFFL